MPNGCQRGGLRRPYVRVPSPQGVYEPDYRLGKMSFQGTAHKLTAEL